MIRGSTPPRDHCPDQSFEPLTVRVSMAVKLTGISRSTIYELIQSGDLPVKKVGRSTLIPFAELKRFLIAANGDEAS